MYVGGGGAYIQWGGGGSVEGGEGGEGAYIRGTGFLLCGLPILEGASIRLYCKMRIFGGFSNIYIWAIYIYGNLANN